MKSRPIHRKFTNAANSFLDNLSVLGERDWDVSWFRSDCWSLTGMHRSGRKFKRVLKSARAQPARGGENGWGINLELYTRKNLNSL